LIVAFRTVIFIDDCDLVKRVKLRDHPLMIRKSGYCSWPPTWTTTRLDPNDKPTGEIGILQQALMNDYLSTKIFLFIEFNKYKYMGAMQFDDARVCSAIYAVLQSHVGSSLKEIGDLDLSHLL
jgi:hypothetical protein